MGGVQGVMKASWGQQGVEERVAAAMLVAECHLSSFGHSAELVLSLFCPVYPDGCVGSFSNPPGDKRV